MKRIITVFLILMSTFVNSQDISVNWDTAATGLSFPEGPAWNGKALFVSNCYSNWVLKIENGRADTFVIAPTSPINFQKTNGLALHKDGSIYACEYGLGAIVKFSPDGKCEMVCPGYEGQKFNRPNDLAFDPHGNLYFTDPKSYDSSNLDGRIFMLAPETNDVKLVYSGLGFPNGIAFSPDAQYLFVCESALHRILKFSLSKRKLSDSPSVFAELPGGDPDGIAFDTNGNLYVAHFGGQAVYIFNPEGKLLKKIITPGKKPSNLEFAGNDMKTLFITEDETNSVYSTVVDVPGLRLFGMIKP